MARTWKALQNKHSDAPSLKTGRLYREYSIEVCCENGKFDQNANIQN
jgi:hypothetical protein